MKVLLDRADKLERENEGKPNATEEDSDEEMLLIRSKDDENGQAQFSDEEESDSGSEEEMAWINAYFDLIDVRALSFIKNKFKAFR